MSHSSIFPTNLFISCARWKMRIQERESIYKQQKERGKTKKERFVYSFPIDRMRNRMGNVKQANQHIPAFCAENECQLLVENALFCLRL